MTRFIHIQRYRSVVLVALAVLFAAFMIIGAPAVMAAKGGVPGKPKKDTSGTTPIDTSGGGDTGTTPTDTSGGGSGTGTTPTGDNSDTTPTDTNGGGDTNTSGGDTNTSGDEDYCQSRYDTRPSCEGLAWDTGGPTALDAYYYCLSIGVTDFDDPATWGDYGYPDCLDALGPVRW